MKIIGLLFNLKDSIWWIIVHLFDRVLVLFMIEFGSIFMAFVTSFNPVIFVPVFMIQEKSISRLHLRLSTFVSFEFIEFHLLLF